MSDSDFKQFVAGMAGSRGVLAPFCGLSGMPVFLANIITEMDGKVQGKIELSADRRQRAGWGLPRTARKTRKIFTTYEAHEVHEEKMRTGFCL